MQQSQKNSKRGEEKIKVISRTPHITVFHFIAENRYQLIGALIEAQWFENQHDAVSKACQEEFTIQQNAKGRNNFPNWGC
jgi:hypothetical protein